MSCQVALKPEENRLCVIQAPTFQDYFDVVAVVTTSALVSFQGVSLWLSNPNRSMGQAAPFTKTFFRTVESEVLG